MKNINNSFVIIYLDYQDVSTSKINKIFDDFSGGDLLEFIKNNGEKYLDKNTYKIIKEKTIEEIKNYIQENLSKYSIGAITRIDNEYPDSLQNIEEPPAVLYYIGDVSLLNKKSIAIVGTRKPTNYGRDVANQFTAELAKSGLVTVSGLSYGIDACCARSTLQEGGKTIAVLAGGLDNIYPAENVGLAREIAKKGLLISEYRPTLRPKQYTFIRRNRIISGLSLGTLVVEAGMHSGATSTAMFAINEGRELFCVPGNISSEQSKGTNDLIYKFPECMVLEVCHILEKLGVHKNDKKANAVQLDLDSTNIINFLADGAKHIDEICQHLQMSMSQVSPKLTMLEITGKVRKIAGNYYENVNLL